MPLTRWIISSKPTESTEAKDAIVNTVYFNVSGSIDEPDYNSLGNDLWTMWAGKPWSTGRFLDVRGYSMSDPEPRPQRFIKRASVTGTRTVGANQIAVCLSYYADRNLPRQRGRLYIGPWTTNSPWADAGTVSNVLSLAPSLAAIGGLNVDWSLWSPTTSTATRINHAWVDNSWDVIRSRKLAASAPRVTWDGNG